MQFIRKKLTRAREPAAPSAYSFYYLSKHLKAPHLLLHVPIWEIHKFVHGVHHLLDMFSMLWWDDFILYVFLAPNSSDSIFFLVSRCSFVRIVEIHLSLSFELLIVWFNAVGVAGLTDCEILYLWSKRKSNPRIWRLYVKRVDHTAKVGDLAPMAWILNHRCLQRVKGRVHRHSVCSTSGNWLGWRDSFSIVIVVLVVGFLSHL
jgi:hypothetical protein